MCLFFAAVVQLKGNNSGFKTELFSLTWIAAVHQIQIIQICHIVQPLLHHQMEEWNLQYAQGWIFTVHQQLRVWVQHFVPPRNQLTLIGRIEG